jgi:hypothetical protein
MTKANIHDRGSISRVYPPDAFARDAARNEEPASLTWGVRILSAPDAAGEFELEAGAQHVGEAAGVPFLAPYRRIAALAGRAPPGGPQQVAEPDPSAGDWRFLDDIVATASRSGFVPEESPGPGDPRLRGLRQ